MSKTNKTFNFEELGRVYVRGIFYINEEHKIIKKYPKTNKEADEIIDKANNPVIVFNPDLEDKSKIKTYISNNFNSDKSEINIEPINIILDLLPILSNIEYKLDRNNETDKQILKNIIEDPNEIFECVMDEIYDIIKEISNHFIKQIKNTMELPKEEIEKILNKAKKNEEPKLSEKELKKIELQKQLEELDKED